MSVPNQRTLVGLLRWCLIQRPWANDKMMAVASGVMDMLLRLDMSTKYPDEISMCSDWFDLVLTSIWGKCKKAGMSASSWLANQKTRAALVLDIPAVEKVLAAETFKTVAPELNCLCSATRLGHALFAWALVPLVSERVSQAIDKKVEEYRKRGGQVSCQTVAELHAECNEAVRDELSCGLGARQVKLNYRGFPLEVTCATPWEEIMLKTSCMLKGAAVDGGSLAGLFVEEELLQSVRVKTESEASMVLHPDVVAPWKAARQAAAESMNKDFSAKEIVTMMTKKLSTYVAIDGTFSIELSLFKALGAAPGEKALLSQLLGCLPTEAQTKCDYAKVVRDMTPFFETRLFSYMPTESQGLLRSVRDVVASVSEHRCPSCIPAVPGGTIAQTLAAIEKTVGEEITTNDGSKKVLTGKAAVTQRLKRLKKQDLSKCGPEALNSVAPFAWLLSASDKASLEEIRMRLIKAGSLRVCKSSSAAAASSTKKKEKTDDMQATLDLFS
eukprot:6491681-Amphidinium_carterae.3